MDNDDVISLFEGDPQAEELIQIWKGTKTGEIHIMINGNFLFVLGNRGLTILKDALIIADQKNNPK